MTSEPEDVISPPYPGEGTTTRMLRLQVLDLVSWVGTSRTLVNRSAGRELVPAVQFRQSPAQFESQPVAAQFRTLMFLRRVREAWDRLIRQFESEWDDPECFRQRALILVATCRHVDEFSKPFELREAESRKRGQREALNKTFEHLNDVLFDLWEPDDGQGPVLEAPG